ncbi:hypothetical protein Dsin_028208 [Dipteronia sinensis]|uniref:Tudor domain-containing protein n=1 Tax=Dipteronia sinensis TaxID=43782 RepID=A0AAD9ZRB0_9ROSI|nr:hypothetical protein Dsin_028208 [Dipteronia sinensis]
MASSVREIDFEEQLKEAGNLLLSPPSETNELIALLDKLESLLSNVEQAPSEPVRGALLPPLKALIANEVLRHPDTTVRMSVASCMSEITRITAPDAPYNDDEMREIFQLIVSAFEKLSDMSGSFYTKAVNCLDIVAKVRTCLVMLDLECDALIVEMFRIFLQVIRSDHPTDIYTAMEKTMTLVIDESEDVSWDLLSTLLSSVRKENQDVSCTSLKLGEEVITNCDAKLKPYLLEAVQSKGIVLKEYADVVSNICKNGDGTLQHSHCNGIGEHMVTKEPDSTSPGDFCHDVDGVSKSMMNGGTDVDASPTRNEDNDKSSKVLEQCSLSEHPKGTDDREPPKKRDEQEHSKSPDARGCAEPDNMSTVKSGIEQERVPRKRGRKPNSLMNPEEGYDHSWISTGRKTRKTAVVPGRRKSLNKGVDQTPSGNTDSMTSAVELSSASPKRSLLDASNSKRGRAKKKGSMMNEDADPNSLSASNEKRLNVLVEAKAPRSANVGVKKEAEDGVPPEIKRRKRSATQYTDLNLKKEPEERCNSATKKRKHSKDRVAVETKEEATPPGGKVSEKEDEMLGDPKLKSKQQSDIKARGRGVNDDRSSNKLIFKKVSLGPAASDKVIAEASGDKKKNISKAAAKSEETPKRKVKRKRSAGKDMKITSKAAVESSTRDGNSSEETPKTEVKRKNTAGKEVASEIPEVGEQLVGSRVKVWWPLDKMFYEGVVNSYDNIKKKHKIVYADGDEETLTLKKQRWELIDSAEEGQGQETDVLKPDASSDIRQKVKEEDTELEPAKEVKQKSSSRRNSSSRRFKAKARKSGGNSAGGAKLDKSNIVDDPTNNLSVKDGKPKEEDENSTGDQMEADINSEQTAKETAIKSVGKSSKVGGESGGECLDDLGKEGEGAKK